MFFRVTAQNDDNTRWYNSLPLCPCTYNDAISRGKTTSPYPKGEWKEFKVLQTFHYGASKEVRWTPDEFFGKPGQQCTYDDKGNLITSGIAAGSPDKQSPGNYKLNVLNHLNVDLKEFMEQPCELYLKGTAPANKGESPCNERDNPVNSITNLIRFVNELTCPDIIRVFQELRDVPNANSTVKEFMIKGTVNDREKAKFLLLYFRGYSTKVRAKSKLSSLKFSNAVIKYLEQYLSEENNIVGDGTFKINPKDVTLPLFKAFKWYTWQNAPEYVKIASKYIKTGESTSLLNDIKEMLDGKCEVKIAVTDLNNDGIAGLTVQASDCSCCCGTGGCIYGLYENGGLLTVDLRLTDEVMPADNGVRASTGRFFPLKREVHIYGDEVEMRKLFTYNQPNREPTPNNDGQLIGGTTPDELGRLIFKAIKNNDRKLYKALIHPHPNEDDVSKIEKNFDMLREGFPERGLTEWNLMKFSRVTFSKDISGWTHDNGTNNGEQVRRAFQVEFTYKNDFVGTIGSMTIVTYKDKYFIYSGGGRSSLDRF